MEAQWQTSLSDPISIDRPDEVADSEIEIVVRQHARFVYKIAYFVLRNHYDAEDVTQETFLRVMKHRKQLPEIQDLRAWLARIAWRAAISRKKVVPKIPLDDAVELLQKLYAVDLLIDRAAGQ